MLELLLCSLLTVLPDYLYRRYAQGKRFGKEITLYSVWFELRWGIVSCLMLTIALITTVLCLAVGYPTAYAIALKTPRAWKGRPWPPSSAAGTCGCTRGRRTTWGATSWTAWIWAEAGWGSPSPTLPARRCRRPF